MWSPHQYAEEAKKKGLDENLIEAAIAQTDVVEQSGLPAILSLNHLAVRAQVPYGFLRGIIERSVPDPYRKFSIRKRSGRRRFIHVPAPSLAHTQKWINKFILQKAPVHAASFAFSPGGSIYKCAGRHCGARWLVKMDITGFFESISEIQAFRCFREMGYQPLVSFELARIVTVGPLPKSPRHKDEVWRTRKWNAAIPSYTASVLGYLPQGAPTSPMLSNLIMKPVDRDISEAARSAGLVYTRYSDDLTFSTSSKTFNRKEAARFVREIEQILLGAGFRPQYRKTAVIPPGNRKIVLGLNVGGAVPKLRKEFKDNLRLHVHYLEKFGPAEHAERREFDTIGGMKAHLRGLIDFANMVEPDYANKILNKFNQVEWPC